MDNSDTICAPIENGRGIKNIYIFCLKKMSYLEVCQERVKLLLILLCASGYQHTNFFTAVSSIAEKAVIQQLVQY